MAEKPRRARPNEVGKDLSDERSGNIVEANRTVGYARASPTEQAGLAGQLRDLRAAGAQRMFREQATSIGPREALKRCQDYLRKGDALVVTTPDRLARNAAELLEIEQRLAQRGIGLLILSIGGARLDTREATSKRMLTVLRGVAAWQREALLERQREGIAKAKAAGKYRGRPPSVDRMQLRKLLTRMGPTDVARTMKIARSTVYKLSA